MFNIGDVIQVTRNGEFVAAGTVKASDEVSTTIHVHFHGRGIPKEDEAVFKTCECRITYRIPSPQGVPAAVV